MLEDKKSVNLFFNFTLFYVKIEGMGQFTLTPSEQEIQAFLKQYKKYLSSSNNPYIRYFFRLEQATASVYTSGKLLLQGEEADK